MKKSVMKFKGNVHPLTLGIEIELQVLDDHSLLLTPRAQEVLDSVASAKLKPEFFQSTLEVITGICADVHEADQDLRKSLDLLRPITTELGLKLASTGTHPEADYRDRLVTPAPRYHALLDRNQWIIRRMAVYGMHVHLGMKSGDDCIQFHNFFLHFVPHLIALSASSPFWQRINTGLSSARPTMYEAMPTSGMPYLIRSWQGFEKIFQGMVRSGAIHSLHDLWLDLRPSPELGTLEIRVCDQPATHTEVVAIASFIHALAHWYAEHRQTWEETHPRLAPWIFRENKWRAMRYGLKAEIIDSSTKMNQLLADDIGHWLEVLQPEYKRLNYESYRETLWQVVSRGNSSDRQLRVYQEHGELHEVIRHNVAEFEDRIPLW